MKKKSDLVATISAAITFFAVAVFFYRGIVDSFDLMKATILHCSLLVLLPLAVWKVATGQISQVLTISTSLLTVGLVLATILSATPASSVFGVYQRYSGLLTLIACLCLAIVVSSISSTDSQRHLRFIVMTAGGVCSFYVALQGAGMDPWEWSTENVNRQVFGTIGNPNTATMFIATTLPFFVVGAIDAGRKTRSIFLASISVSLGAVLGILDSFQGVLGYAAVLFSLGFVGVARGMPVTVLVRGVLLTVVSLLFAFFGRTGWHVIFGALTGLVLQLVSELLLKRFSGESPNLKWSNRRLGVYSVVFGATLAGLSRIPRVAYEIRGGFRERGSFYRAAIGAFSERPLFGYGLDTFGRVFSRFRPSSHAVELEFNRTSSVHSIPLGMLVNGGVVLAVGWLFLFLATLRVSIRLIKSAEFRLADLALIASWLAFSLQSLFSVEHVALFTLLAVVTGLLFARERTLKVGGPLHARSSTLRWSLVGLGVALSPLILIFGTATFRADKSSVDALRAIAIGDASQAISNSAQSVQAAPWEPIFLTRRINILQDVSSPEVADEAIKLVRMTDFNPMFGIEIAYVVTGANRVPEGLEIARRMLSNDPHARVLRIQVVDLFVQVGDYYASVGDREAARSVYEEALSYDPDNAVALAALAQL